MENKLNILMFCKAPDICTIVNKFALLRNIYNIKYINLQFNEEGFPENIPENPECVIIDESIESQFFEMIIKKFNNTEYIFLPSLDEMDSVKIPPCNYKKMSEPFKLSELISTLNEIYSRKYIETNKN
jgi:hypothetical protein